jgi:hypothetical protein
MGCLLLRRSWGNWSRKNVIDDGEKRVVNMWKLLASLDLGIEWMIGVVECGD